jgi:hypothetical protein
MHQQQEHAQHPASLPSRPAPHHSCPQAAEPRRAFHPSRPAPRRGSDHPKALLTPRSEPPTRLDRSGSCAQNEGEEIDPTAGGTWGYLHVTYKVLECNREGCKGEFVSNGVITGRGKRTSEMQLPITVDNAAWPSSELYDEYGSVPGISTPTYYDTIFIPYGTTYTFNLLVKVGKHKEILRLAFTAVEGEIIY